jgi:hypothetical protein
VSLDRRTCPLGQTLSNRISEHPEFGAPRGCLSRCKDQVRNGLSGESRRITTLLGIVALGQTIRADDQLPVMARRGPADRLNECSLSREFGYWRDVPRCCVMTQADIGADRETWSIASPEEMAANDLDERNATGSNLLALPNAVVHFSASPPTGPDASLSRVPERLSPQEAPYFPSYGLALVKTALSVGQFADRAEIRRPPSCR